MRWPRGSALSLLVLILGITSAACSALERGRVLPLGACSSADRHFSIFEGLLKHLLNEYAAAYNHLGDFCCCADAEAGADDEVTCPGIPAAPARASFAFDDCRDMVAGEECDGECAAGTDGMVTATCRADGTFEVAGSCETSVQQVRGDRAGENC